ncbi:glycosyl-4,4'-diaponeurosporenoate acyltransferase [Paenibacillus sp. Marseille-Q4541]|uniref:glycosyl-4,4'-diaponeurosporenoate acyltransferase CrtO family protein n=1 Tax=Paenibacillus sp. Marseille-Q4541 TaxID=2831522 RepID=UPI001BA9E298|nr:glycosyl-4,4'-diaponeurosporenoate acyltransferase [Paenibacillus sp. Marseille-Q4541]
MPIWEWSIFVTVSVNIMMWLLIHLSISYFFSRLPDRWFEGLQYTASKRELIFYDRILHIKRWKNHLPDGAAFLGQDFRKSHIQQNDTDYLRKYQLEAWRGEWCHYVSIWPVPLFFLWNLPVVAWVMMGYAIAANAPCILSLRYNRARIVRILQRRGEALLTKNTSEMTEDPSPQ